MNGDRNKAVEMIAEAAAEAAVNAIIAEPVGAGDSEARRKAVAAGVRAGIEKAPTAFKDTERRNAHMRYIVSLNE